MVMIILVIIILLILIDKDDFSYTFFCKNTYVFSEPQYS